MSNARRFPLAIVIALVACSEHAPDAPDSADAGAASDATSPDAAGVPSEAGADTFAERSGARIKLTFEASADGFRLRSGLYDAQLDVACMPALSEDGQWRCLPQEAASAEMFTDSDCKQRVATLGECSPKPMYAIAAAELVTCAQSKQRVFAVGAQLTPETLYARVDNGCEAVPVTTTRAKYFRSPRSPPRRSRRSTRRRTRWCPASMR